MIVAEDLRTRTGILLVTKGYQVSESFVARLRQFQSRSATHRDPHAEKVRRETPQTLTSAT